MQLLVLHRQVWSISRCPCLRFLLFHLWLGQKSRQVNFVHERHSQMLVSTNRHRISPKAGFKKYNLSCDFPIYDNCCRCRSQYFYDISCCPCEFNDDSGRRTNLLRNPVSVILFFRRFSPVGYEKFKSLSPTPLLFRPFLSIFFSSSFY